MTMRLTALLLAVLLSLPVPCPARSSSSSYTPRESGTEPPGGPRPAEGLPTPGSFGRTPEGGMGFTDAYGNTITDRVEEKKPHTRLRPGAYGTYGRKDPDSRPLPEPARSPSRPAWKF